MTTMMSKYDKTDICCVFVTYNGDNDSIEKINYAADNLDLVVVVDNHSNNNYLDCLKTLDDKIELVINPKNLGIASALNKGLSVAKEHNKKLLLTMDQDSTLTIESINYMISLINLDDRIAAVGPSYGNDDLCDDKNVKYLITSGNLLRTDILCEVGGYDESLFIDEVDIDISYAIRRAGYLLFKSAEARMDHKIGEYETSRILHIKHLTHSSNRFFYMYRNTVIIVKRYWSFIPKECLKLLVALFMYDTLQLLLLENNKLEKIHFALKGFIEGIKHNDKCRSCR